MSIIGIFLIILVVLLVASIFYHPVSGSYQYAPSGIIGLILIVLLILFLLHVV